MRVVALLAIRNEELYLARCLQHLYEQGIETCLIDNDSTDKSKEIANSFIGRGVFRIDDIPYNGLYEWEKILKYKEKLASEIDADWFIHHDADEIREAPKPYKTLLEGIEAVDRQGYNAINFDEFTFWPTDNDESFENKDYVKEMKYYYFFEPMPLYRVNAWKKTENPVILRPAGHKVGFKGIKIYPESFILRHYIVLSRTHALRKYAGRVYQIKGHYGTQEGRVTFTPEQLTFPKKESMNRVSNNGIWDKSNPQITFEFLGNKQLNYQVINYSPKAHIPLPKETGNINYCIDKVGDNPKYFQIVGWAHITGKDATNNKIFVVLRSKDTMFQKSLIFEPTVKNRPDVSEHFSPLDLNSSGFSAVIPKGELESKKYEIGILINNNDTFALQYTNIFVHKNDKSRFKARSTLTKLDPMPFIVGVSRSGTTLLRLMLDAHSQLAIPPETHFIPSISGLVGEGSKLLNDFHRIITTCYTWENFQISSDEFRKRLSVIKPFNMSDGLRCFYKMYAERFNKSRWGEKTPHYIVNMSTIKDLLPEAHFIHIIRDGRDVACSLRNLHFGPGNDIEAQAAEWVWRIREGRQQAQVCEHYLEVRYEDLLTKTEIVLNKVCSFINLPFERSMLEYNKHAEERLKEFSDWRNPDGTIRFNKEQLQGVHKLTTSLPDKTRIGRWQNEMTEDEIRKFEAIAGNMLRELGYQ